MTSATVDTREVKQNETVLDRAIDACRQVAHCSHEAQLLKSLATDAVDDGVHAARRAIVGRKREPSTHELGQISDQWMSRAHSRVVEQ